MYSHVIDRKNKSCINDFRRFIEQTSLFEQQKHRFQKPTKLAFLPNGLVHGFGQKFEMFINVSFYAKDTQKKYSVTFSLENKPF